MWVIEGKSESLISNKRLGIYGGTIIVTASSILDVGSEPESVSGVCINY